MIARVLRLHDSRKMKLGVPLAQDRGGAGELRDTCAAHFDVRLEALVRAAQAQDAASQE